MDNKSHISLSGTNANSRKKASFKDYILTGFAPVPVWPKALAFRKW